MKENETKNMDKIYQEFNDNITFFEWNDNLESYLYIDNLGNVMEEQEQDNYYINFSLYYTLVDAGLQVPENFTKWYEDKINDYISKKFYETL